MIIDRVFLSFAISTTALIIILLIGPILLREGQITIEKQSISNGKAINRTLETIQERTNIQLSQLSIHADRGLGDLNGNLSLLMHQLNTSGEKSRDRAVDRITDNLTALLKNITGVK